MEQFIHHATLYSAPRCIVIQVPFQIKSLIKSIPIIEPSGGVLLFRVQILANFLRSSYNC